MDGFYIYVSNLDSEAIYEQNTDIAFTVQLPHQINLKGSWVVALKQITVQSEKQRPPSVVYVYCDLCNTSYVLGQDLPLLR